jgi:hypothetical protein
LQPGEVFYDQENEITITATGQSSDGLSMGFTVASNIEPPVVEPPVVEPPVEPPVVTPIEPSPVTLAISAGKGHRQNLWWSSVDTSEVSYYEVIRNGATIAITTNTAYEDRSASKGNIYNYVVVAVNAAGLRSEDSNTVTANLSTSKQRR